ncbi:MAG: protein translocase subunit SecD [Actinomycetota bacterium]
MLNRPLVALVGILVVTAGLFTWSRLAGQEPLLGLDLQGGVEVVLEPVDTPENRALATQENLDLAVEILRSRVDAIGVAEPDITTQTGEENFIIVQLPGIEDQDEAVALVGQTAELQFRPVLFDLVDAFRNGIAIPDEEVFGPEVTRGGPGLLDLANGVVSDPNFAPADQSAIFLTASDDADNPGTPVLVGPTEFTGSALDGAEAQFINGGWLVQVTFKAGAEGLELFNQSAARCFNGASPSCPTGRLAFVLDGVVESAPNINAPEFTDRRVVITRDNGFREEDAKNSALVLEFGALPLAFADPADPEAGLVRTVSASLGQDSLDAGLIAGLVGLALVALYMLWYYRLLGLAAMLSLGVSATLLWVIVSYLSASRGLALTLAGVVGLIVSIGVSLDSNVIFFEDLKEHYRSPGGAQAVSSSVNQSFPRAFSTVFWANLATLIGALILYLLTVGSVRGFALMLALASVLDLIATYFFMGPFVRLMVDRFKDRPEVFGIRQQRGKTDETLAGADA